MEVTNCILFWLSSGFTYLVLVVLREWNRVREMRIQVDDTRWLIYQVDEEIRKRKTAEMLRYSERVGRVRAEKVAYSSSLFRVGTAQSDRGTEEGRRGKWVHVQPDWLRSFLLCSLPGSPETAWIPPPAFDDLAQYSHVWVLFVFHMNTNVSTLHRSATEKGFTFPVALTLSL